MDKAYDPARVEKEIYREWMAGHLFSPRKGAKKTFTMMLPPPNVTGNLHMGHALTVTIEDALSRFRRMKGERVLWLPGFDHAGIATQVVVERELKKKGINRRQLGREAFTKEVWKWVEEYKGNIENQLKSMGSSLDWGRARFTFDEKYQDAVKEAFLHLHKKGLIYRGERMINWCARCQTVLSDLEVEYSEEEARLYYIAYGPFILATVRPETKLGDTAVAVNPNDKRYKKYVGQTIKAKSVEGEISLRVIADEAVDRAFGTGVIKVTPAHDPDDFEIGKRHNLETKTVIGFDNKMNENAGAYRGLTIEEARKRIVEDMEKLGLIEKVEDYKHRRGYCSRCNTPIEPQISLQWFISTKPLARSIIKAAKEGKIIFVPGRFKKIFLQWLENIQDWCISRQLWWGHQLPVFYCSKKQEEFKMKNEKLKVNDYIVAKEKPNICAFCKDCSMIQDSDVLDTWFSSGLWPFATLGWPKKTSDIKAFYPNDVLETGYDILFFWVARMLMLGKELTGKLPFHTVYLHGLVRDKQGRKMSKSLGNVIDPLDLSAQYGTDALRFALLYGNSPGNDMRFDPSHLIGGRNFANKLWNIVRFAKLKGTSKNLRVMPTDAADREFITKLSELQTSTTRHLEHFRLAQALQEIHNFVWHELADKYLEHVKVSNDPQKVFNFHFSISILLKLLHPFMPFLTEALWKELGMGKKEGFLIHHSWT